MPNLTDASIKKIEQVARDTFEMQIVPESPIEEPKPFQFVSLLYGNYQLRRPFSIAGFDGESLRIVFKVRGRMTSELSKAKPGEKLSVLGPLGKPIQVREFQRILAVAGGVGIAPFLYFISKESSNRDISLIYGVRTLDDAWYEDAFTELKGFLLVTEDGSSNYHGYAVDYIFSVAKYFNPDLIIAVGPSQMLPAVRTASIQLGVPALASLEPYMGCGLGACCSCLVKTVDGGYVKVCTDGPVFNLNELVLEVDEI